jgi:hypothetical protein
MVQDASPPNPGSQQTKVSSCPFFCQLSAAFNADDAFRTSGNCSGSIWAMNVTIFFCYGKTKAANTNTSNPKIKTRHCRKSVRISRRWKECELVIPRYQLKVRFFMTFLAFTFKSTNSQPREYR